MAINTDGEKNSARSAIILAAAVFVLAIFVVEFGLQTLVWVSTKRWNGADPWLADVPQAIPAAEGIATLPDSGAGKKDTHAMLKAYGYEFIAPWPGKNKQTAGLTYTQFAFDSGQTIVFFDPEAQLDTMSQLKNAKTPEYQQFENVFGDEAPDTNFALYRTVYSASPAQVSPFMHREDAEQMNVLLLWKLSFGFDMQPGIHSFSLGKNSGFEFGEPASGRPVALRVFDDKDKQFRFIFTTAAGSSGKFTQQDISLVAQSLQIVPLLER